MPAFFFNSVRSVIAAPGAVSRLGEVGLPLLGPRALIITDKGVAKAGLVKKAFDALESVGIEAQVFDGVEPDPPAANVMAGLEAAAAHNATGIVGFGGGSSMDVAKVVALLARSGEALDDVYGVMRAKGPRLPLVCVPTTAGTGSEATAVAVLSVSATDKKPVAAPLLIPDIAILDAELTLGLPPDVTAATGIDAMVHAIEAYTSINANNSVLSRALAREALGLLGPNLLRAVQQGSDLEAREAMLQGAFFAGQALAAASVGAVHAIAYPLGCHFHIAHGITNALMLAPVMRFNLPACAQAYGELAPVIFPELAGLTGEPAAVALISELQKLIVAAGLPGRLRDAGVGEDQLPMLAREGLNQPQLMRNNPRPVNEAEALALYREAW